MYTPAEWRVREAAEQFVATECQSCGYVCFPQRRKVCKRCGEIDPKWETVELERRGKVRSYVVQNRLPESFDTPLPIGVVDVSQVDGGEPARVYGLFTDTKPADVEVGISVEADFREIYDIDGLPMHSFKFKRPRSEY